MYIVHQYLKISSVAKPVLRIRIQDPGWEKIRIRSRDKSQILFLKAYKQVFGKLVKNTFATLRQTVEIKVFFSIFVC
jgi:hypothetical protein